MPKTTRPNSFIPVLLVSVVIGFLAGIVGTIVAAAIIAVPTPPETAVNLLRSIQRQPAAGRADASLAAEAGSRSLALFFPAKAAGKYPVDDVFVESEALAAGVVLTSDGWLMTASSALPSAAKLGDRSVVVGARRYALERVVRDSYSGVAFVKVAASNLPVTAFGDSLALAPGEELFALDAGRGLRRTDVIGLADAPVADRGSLTRSSERLQKTLRLTAFDEILPGAALFDSRGQVVGMYLGAAGARALAAPFHAFSGRIDEVLKGASIARPRLGLGYVEVSQLYGYAGAPEAARPNRGALVAASLDGKIPAVAAKSPAAAAGVRPGDIVLAVNDEEVSAKKGLADILAEYDPGAKVTLTLRRAGADRRVEAVLGLEASP